MSSFTQGRRARIPHDRAAIVLLLDRILSEIGAERFSGLRLLELEKVARAYDRDLPGKTVLREVINAYRTAKWPHTQPKKSTRWSRS